MKNILFDLETRFFKLPYISDKNWLDKTLHDNFHECGKSGLLYNKKETINSLLSCKTDRNIKISHFDCMPITVNSWLAHYITECDNKKYYRTSVWVTDSDSTKLLFHQASELNPFSSPDK